MDGAGVYVFSYDGRLVCSPKHQGLKADLLNMQTITLSNDTVAIRDKIDEKGWLPLFLSIALFLSLSLFLSFSLSLFSFSFPPPLPSSPLFLHWLLVCVF